ncbi:MAG: PKD domain-containing protein [bacterium]|nr:PKD domain-containing protein [bacterium]
MMDKKAMKKGSVVLMLFMALMFTVLTGADYDPLYVNIDDLDLTDESASYDLADLVESTLFSCIIETEKTRYEKGDMIRVIADAADGSDIEIKISSIDVDYSVSYTDQDYPVIYDLFVAEQSGFYSLTGTVTQNGQTCEKYSGFEIEGNDDIIITVMGSGSEITITNPEDSSILTNGENVALEFNVEGETGYANCSLDGTANETIIADSYNGSHSLFSEIILGTLEEGTFENGAHSFVVVVGNNTAQTDFEVNDNIPPELTVLRNGEELNNSAFSADDYLQQINISSDEYANISYKLNDAAYTEMAYLGTGKLAIISMQLQNDTNNLIINATDLNGNNILRHYVFSFSLVSCDDGIQNGDETGIDCGGSCNSCVEYGVSTDQGSYVPYETVYVTVDSRSQAVHNITITGPEGYYYSVMNTGSSNYILSPSAVGNYEINVDFDYRGNLENKVASFEVNSTEQTNPLAVELHANETTVIQGEHIYFEAEYSGNVSAVAISWDFDEDGTTDSTAENLTYSYDTTGTYIVNLTVSDVNWSKSDITVVDVRQLYDVDVEVRDNRTNALLANAKVDFDGEIKNTTSAGVASFKIPSGSYALIIKRDSYKTHAETITVHGNMKINVSFIEIITDTQAPIITIVSPADGSTVGSPVQLTYSVSDNTNVVCRLYTSTDSEWWTLHSTSGSIANSDNQQFTVDNLEIATHYWELECEDDKGNSKKSGIYSFAVSEIALASVEAELEPITEAIIEKIDTFLFDLGYFGKSEKEAAEALKLKETLDDLKLQLKRANRDLHDVMWRKDLDDEGKKQEKEKIHERIAELERQVPATMSVAESTEYVSYPDNSDVLEATSLLIESQNKKFESKDKEALAKENEKLQSLITVTTQFMILDFGYVTGESKSITLIEKSVKINGNLSEEHILAEFIPKTVANTADEVNLLFEHEILNSDPLIGVELSEENSFAYYFDRQLSSASAESAKTIVLSSSMNAESSKVTGFAVFKKFGALADSMDMRLTIEILIVIILIAVYLVYSFGGVDSIKTFLHRDEHIKKVNEILSKADGYLEDNKYEDAKKLYKELTQTFTGLPPETRKKTKGNVVDLCYRLDAMYIKNLVDQALVALTNNKRKEARELYVQANTLYKRVSPKYKKQVHEKCMLLYEKFNIK